MTFSEFYEDFVARKGCEYAKHTKDMLKEAFDSGVKSRENVLEEIDKIVERFQHHYKEAYEDISYRAAKDILNPTTIGNGIRYSFSYEDSVSILSLFKAISDLYELEDISVKMVSCGVIVYKNN